ncbi:MAG TPA: adenylyl-sulfate kinase, partial [Rhodobiaceae bacterium]|nr:adenylyl-sulfate kinase [Rhodobiaceae bacterium]
TLEHLAAKTLDLNAIGVCTFSTDKPIVFEPYGDSKTLGGFVLIDKMSNNTVAAGMINFSLRRAHNIHWQAADVDRDAHAALKNQTPKVLW